MNSDIKISASRFTAPQSRPIHSSKPRFQGQHSFPNPPDSPHPLSRQMQVVNLEASLAVWKSFRNKDLLAASESYRSLLASNLRFSPSFTGSMPASLIRHGLGFDLGG
jgi:hypothetical protein